MGLTLDITRRIYFNWISSYVGRVHKQPCALIELWYTHQRNHSNAYTDPVQSNQIKYGLRSALNIVVHHHITWKKIIIIEVHPRDTSKHSEETKYCSLNLKKNAENSLSLMNLRAQEFGSYSEFVARSLPWTNLEQNLIILLWKKSQKMVNCIFKLENNKQPNRIFHLISLR